MKITTGASSILLLASFFLLAGCETFENIHIPRLFSRDEVPDEVKDQPRFVEIPMTPEEEASWPRLGDVPFKPKDFTPKPAYEKSMDELAHDRFEAETARQQVLMENAAPTYVAPQDNQEEPVLRPPQFSR